MKKTLFFLLVALSFQSHAFAEKDVPTKCSANAVRVSKTTMVKAPTEYVQVCLLKGDYIITLNEKGGPVIELKVFDSEIEMALKSNSFIGVHELSSRW
ncbi:MAG: hypothetical protein ACD_8C00058G0001 [uncultured bacterium]|nr:MAG: hypothetical protein ACD_8C00058G0001 [uncultured bacterium]